MINNLTKIIFIFISLILLRNVGIALAIPLYGIFFGLPSAMILFLMYKFRENNRLKDIRTVHYFFGLITFIASDALQVLSHPDPKAAKLDYVIGSIAELKIPLHDFNLKNRRCPKFASELLEVKKSVLLDPYSSSGNDLKFKTTRNNCYIYSIGPDGVDNFGEMKIANASDFFGKAMLAMKPVVAHKGAYDFLFGNKKNRGDIVVSVAVSPNTSEPSQTQPK